MEPNDKVNGQFSDALDEPAHVDEPDLSASAGELAEPDASEADADLEAQAAQRDESPEAEALSEGESPEPDAPAAEAAPVDGPVESSAPATEAAPVEEPTESSAPQAVAAPANAPADDAGERATKPKKGRRGPWLVVFVVALVVFVASLTALGVIAFSYLQGQQKYQQISETSDFDPTGLEADGGLAKATVDWDALRAVNPDVVGWVYIPNTVINYPIVQGEDNDYYLLYDFDGDQGWLAEYGAIFLDYRNKADWSDQASFVYGHHMNDGSMFADIAGMQDQARFDECRTVYLLTPQGNFKLRSFSLVHCDASDPIVITTFGSRDELTAYIQDKMDRSIVTVGDAPLPTQIGRMMVFATCDNYSAGRYVLFTYIQDTTAEGLTGSLGLEQAEDGQTTGFDNELQLQE